MWTIYALVDPRTSQIRYIGQTQNHPEVRLQAHIEKDDTNRYKRAWISELRRLGEKPTVVTLEYAPSIDDALEAERIWIRRGHRLEWPLLNFNANNYAERKYVRRYIVEQAEKPPRPSVPPKPEGPTNLQTAVWAWRDAHPTGTQAELRGDFAARGIEIARGYAHECWHKYPGNGNWIDMSTAEGRAAFAAMAASARLPNGNKIATDITGGVA